MALEVEVDGNSSLASDVFSAGVTLLELWVGSIGRCFDEYDGCEEVDDEGLRAMRKEVLEVLQRVERADSTVGALLRKCCSQDKNNRPSAKALVTAFKKLNGITTKSSSKAKSRWKKTGLGVVAANRMKMTNK